MVRWKIWDVYGNQHPVNNCHGLLHCNNSPGKHWVVASFVSEGNNSWAAIGIGQKMVHSLMFIIVFIQSGSRPFQNPADQPQTGLSHEEELQRRVEELEAMMAKMASAKKRHRARSKSRRKT
jgi:hypothetical protein